MSTFEDACRLSCERWVDSLPDKVPEHRFSQKHNEKMKELFSEGHKTDIRKLSKRTIRLILIAAILLALSITAYAVPAFREFTVNKFLNHSEYEVSKTEQVKKVKSLKVNYIPAGFKISEDYGTAVLYKNKDKIFAIEKATIDASIGYDTEKYEDEIIEINGIKAVYYRSDDENSGIIFNNGDYIFMVSGNIEKEELVKIAQNVE